MVEQTKDSTFTDYGLAHAEPGLLNSDEQLSESIAAKKSVSQDSHNEKSMTVSKSIGDPLLVESGRADEVVDLSGTKRPSSESLLSPPKSNAGGGHIVYVRRKPETELGKSHVRESQSNAVDCTLIRESTQQVEETQQHAETSGPMIATSDVSPLQRSSSPSLSPTRPSVSPWLGTSGGIPSPGNANHVYTDSGNPPSDDRVKANIKLWEERYRQLQRLLKTLDESHRDDYVQMLRSLSSVELSQHAFELEKRSIKLSLEEAGELQRAGLSEGVLDKHQKNVGNNSAKG